MRKILRRSRYRTGENQRNGKLRKENSSMIFFLCAFHGRLFVTFANCVWLEFFGHNQCVKKSMIVQLSHKQKRISNKKIIQQELISSLPTKTKSSEISFSLRSIVSFCFHFFFSLIVGRSTQQPITKRLKRPN